jgi:UDP-glucose 4-epimerase
MRILITGGAGFIGSHLAEELLQRGHEVSIIDDLSTGSIDNIQHLKPNPKFHYAIDSIMNESLTAELIDECAAVFHLAAAVGVRLIVEDPIRTMETNIHGTEIVLKHANKKKKKVILASTSEVYGKGNNIPFREDEDLNLGPTIKNRWSYACSKAIDEFLALAYWKKCRLPIVIVRLFNTVGPRQTGQYGMVLPTFVKQALQQRPITVFGDGSQTRCFGYVGDVVKAMIDLALHAPAVGEIVNLGSNEEISIKNLAHLVKEMTNSPSEIVYVSYDEAYEQGFEDMQKRIPSLEKAHRLIGYAPTVNLREIVSEVIDFYKDKNS